MDGVVLAEGWRGGEHLRDRQVLVLVSISCPVPRQEVNDPWFCSLVTVSLWC